MYGRVRPYRTSCAIDLTKARASVMPSDGGVRPAICAQPIRGAQGPEHFVRYIAAFNIFSRSAFSPACSKHRRPKRTWASGFGGIPARGISRTARNVDSSPTYSQILSLAMPAIDRSGTPTTLRMGRIGNDELAELVANIPGVSRAMRHPADERTAGAIKEAERVLTNGANAIQPHQM